MKRIMMAALLSLMLWAGANIAAHAEGAAAPQGTSEAAAVAGADTLGGMTESEAFKVRKAEIELERQRALVRSYPEDILEGVAQLMAVTVPFIFAFLVIFFYIYFRNKQKQTHYKVIETAIEAGRELPDKFFETSSPKPARPDKLAALNQGLVFLGIGLGLALWSIVKWCIGGTETFAGGYGIFIFGLALICILVGAGKMVLYRISSRRDNGGTETDQED